MLRDKGPWGMGVLIFLGVFLAVVAVWREGLIRGIDFLLYDRFVRAQERSRPEQSAVVLVGITEADIRAHDYPIPDRLLARVLRGIAEGGARMIGLDLYRDLPEPRSGMELGELNQALMTLSNVVVIERLADLSTPGIPPPAVMKGFPERVGFNNFPLDAEVGNSVRRGYLFAGEHGGDAVRQSLSLLLAAGYLREEGVQAQPALMDPEHLLLGRREYVPLGADDGAYVNGDDDGYQVLLDFRGPSSFTSHTLSEVIDGLVPAGAFEDRIVIVGAMSGSIKDHHITPLRGPVYGVELHGHLTDQLVRSALDGGRPLRFLGEGRELGLLMLCCLAGVVLPSLARSVIGSLLLVLAGPVLLFGLNQWGFRAGFWIPIGPSVVAMIPAAVLTTAYRLSSERRDRRVLMQLFSQHVSSEIAKELWENRAAFSEGLRPVSKALTVTILFADLRGFGEVAGRLAPGVLIEWLNRYLEAMSAQILGKGGIVNEYVGDGIMATFGIPIPRQTEREIGVDAVNAVESALLMAGRLEDLNRRWRAQGLPEAGMRVGIFTGPVVAGTVGSLARMKYAVVGDAVNAAERLESFDREFNSPRSPIPGCRILVGEPTWSRLEGAFEGERVGAFVLKGRQEETTIHQIFKRR